MSRSNYYAEVSDAGPVLKMMDELADAGLPFFATEYDDDYEEETQEGNPFGEGESKRQAAKRGDVFVRDNERIADFRVRIEDGSVAKILAPRGNL